ncbi:MAG: efflux RND transporter periplasmic adaptor subunit, partial [Burkholderiales bacterium]|nr:efflux RND transporter periplasmic adaptor subunit [Burkholderiales bacterium]
SGQVVATMAVSGDKEVVVELPEAQVNNYKAGMQADIKLWATDKTYKGSIRVINGASDQQTRTFTARIMINSPESDIKYGMAADVKLSPLNSRDGIDLPINSIYSINGKSYVWLINAKSQVEQVEVDVLSTDGNIIRVNSPTLKDGDRIVEAGANFIHSGQTVKEY